jgi:N-acetylmuramoyl-L-alanine amidase
MLRKLFKLIGDFFRSLFGRKPPVPTPEPVDPPTEPEIPVEPEVPVEPEIPTTPGDISDSSEIPITDEITVSDTDSLVVISGPAEGPIVVEEVEEPEEPPAQGRYTWCLDNGHGQKSAGKRSPIFDDGETQFFEYEFNRDIVERIITRLQELGISYFDVMPEVETNGNDLQERVTRANQHASTLPKLFVSVHANAGPEVDNGWTLDTVSGIETWYYFGSVKGKKMASTFQKKLIEKTGWKDRGLKTSKTSPFYVLKKTVMPAILTENGFFNNKAQALDLMKDEVRQSIADAHIAAIQEIEANGL